MPIRSARRPSSFNPISIPSSPTATADPPRSFWDGVTGRSRTARRKRWAIAAGVSLTAHLLVFAGMIAGVDHPFHPPPPPPMELTLERLPTLREKPPEPERRPPPPPPRAIKPPPPAPAAALEPPARPAPPAAQPAPYSSISGIGRTPRALPSLIGPSQKPGDSLKMGCLGKNLEKLDNKSRLDCEQQIYAYINSRQELPPDAYIDPAKKAAYEAALARKRYKAAPVSSLGNASQSGCPGANMGMGCPGEIELPLAKKAF
jgi:hypothetical protein